MQQHKANCNHVSRNCKSPENPAFVKEIVDTGFLLDKDQHHSHIVLGDIRVDGDEAAIKMQSNDYLSIASDKRIAAAKAEILLEQGHGDAMSRVFTHDREDVYKSFEKRMASILGAEDAVLCMSGYNANTGIIQAFAKQGTNVYIDIKAHASLWEGIACARARARPFRHNNIDDLHRKIKRYGPGLIVVDALYSTNGKICPLEKLVEIAEDYACAIILDETHSFGCHGNLGGGIAVEMGIEDKIHFRTIGLSKAIAARGGVVAGSKRNMEFFRYEAFPMIFSTSVLAYEIAGFEKTLDIINSETWRREKLHENHAYLRDGLLSLGYDVGECDSQIIAIIAGSNPDTIILRDYLASNGIFGSVFAPPATAEGAALVRFTINADLNRQDLDKVLGVFAKARYELDLDCVPRLCAFDLFQAAE
ncbi:alpha-hydroxyketone-type quorum-sensing autoinducer synthase [Kordiimonas sp. SCSIO 12610]|uniref:alpha-hydroxyketone-type quorum-sensing autoinducer synthase n=1 Tax=Kordiimonas sp. SCSIO 12610 TaxID=2829597 RepID=UPI00210B5A65|nr:alpha-hydroxyketone-type quorum-sensing autoinducer synthase [Kordiimonas sp. SCSIO 12610]UTW54461.1 quorum-sensing autoinducer CAI-1 synthase [Kordiimonas sp. SCSIO 12610]